MERAVAWILNQPITTICSAGDQALLPTIIDAAEKYQEMDEAAQLSLLHVPNYGDFFVPGLTDRASKNPNVETVSQPLWMRDRLSFVIMITISG